MVITYMVQRFNGRSEYISSTCSYKPIEIVVPVKTIQPYLEVQVPVYISSGI